ncbi:hypothetical protein CN918_31550 [Priestia megaterium]|nr:hypothetical protein CN918_31550 [Priestia megaterium]
MKCPKCQASMVEVREEDVFIDICKECRGVFLDAGELHALLYDRSHTKEAVHHPHPHYPQQHPHQEHPHHKHNHNHNHHYYTEHKPDHHSYKHHKKKKKKMHHVLGDLFDF